MEPSSEQHEGTTTSTVVHFGSRRRRRRRAWLRALAVTVALALAAAAVVHAVRGHGALEMVRPLDSFELRSGRSQDIAFAGVALRNRSDRPVRITGISLGTRGAELRPGDALLPDAQVVFAGLLVAQGPAVLVPGYELGWPPLYAGNGYGEFRPFTLSPGNEVQLVMRLGRLSADPAELRGLTVEYRQGGARHTQRLPLRLRFTEPG